MPADSGYGLERVEAEFNSRWWTESSDVLVASALKETYRHLDDLDRGRQKQNLQHLRLYGNLPIAGVKPSTYNRVIGEDRVTLNVIANVCDLGVARIGKQRPAAKVLPAGGNHSLRKKSILLERFLQAQFRISDVYGATRRMFLDACVFGTGVVKVYSEWDKIRVERIFPSEILVDPLEGLYGEPRMLIQRKWISKAVLRELFVGDGRGKSARLRAVVDAQAEVEGEDLYGIERDHVGDQVLVLEAWHLPSGPDADDGKHVICTSAGPLVVEDYDKDHFPFLFMRWKERLRGFWGVGLAEELTGIQIELNRLLIRVQSAMKRLGGALVFLDARSKVQENALTNEIGSFVKYMGNEPKVVTWQTTHPEVFQQIDRLYQRAFDVAGMSQDTASPGTSSISGVSAQTQHEIGTERFAPQAQDFEQLHLTLSKYLIEEAKALSKQSSGKYALPAKNDRNTISVIDWADVDMEKDEYIIQVLPVSSFPQLPGPRQDRVIQMLQAGMIDPQTANELLDFPDLERFMDLERAGTEAIDRAIENMLDEGLREVPEPYIDLQLALKRTQASYNKAQNDGVDEDRLQLLRDYMTAAHALMQKAQLEQMKLAGAVASQNQPPPPAPGAPPAPGPDGQPPGALTPGPGGM